MNAAQKTFSSAYHESGHLASAYLCGWKIHGASVHRNGDSAGRCEIEPPTEGGMERTLQEMTIYLAGSAAWQVALAASPEHARAVGAVPVQARDLSPDELHAAGQGTPYVGWTDYERNHPPDLQHVERVARETTGDEREAEALISLARARAAALVSTPLFQALVERAAVALIANGELGGDEIRCELQRAELSYYDEGTEG